MSRHLIFLVLLTLTTRASSVQHKVLLQSLVASSLLGPNIVLAFGSQTLLYPHKCWGFHGGDCSDCRLLECDIAERRIPTFRKNMLHLSSELKCTGWGTCSGFLQSVVEVSSPLWGSWLHFVLSFARCTIKAAISCVTPSLTTAWVCLVNIFVLVKCTVSYTWHNREQSHL
jgi:hypothetical protein